MDSSSKNVKTVASPTINSVLSSIFCGLLFAVLSFIGWYLWLRPKDEEFPFSSSRIEIFIIVALMALIGFWIGSKVEQTLYQSRYQFVFLYFVAGCLLFLSGIGVGYLIWGNQSYSAADAGSDEEEITIPENIKRYDVPDDNDPSFGSKDADITIIQFADYECPFCAKWQLEVWPEIMKTFPNQVRLVYRDFPLYGLHANAESAAEAANCAGEQNAYWEYHEKLFEAKNGLGMNAFLQYAKELGLKQAQFSECLESNRYIDEIKADYEYASNLGVSSAPTFFINGIPVVGAQSFSVFKQLITKELAGEIP